MKTLVINEMNHQGYETKKTCTASTLKNAFKKANIRRWDNFRIYQVYSDRTPHIIYETDMKLKADRFKHTYQKGNFSLTWN